MKQKKECKHESFTVLPENKMYEATCDVCGKVLQFFEQCDIIDDLIEQAEE